jgi:micrococcal nuclease
MRRIVLCLALVLTACRTAPSTAATTTAAATAALTENATVERVVDGDTIVVRAGGGSERVRLIGIDTPETKKEGTPVQCYGPEASAYTESLLPAGTRLHLERDVVARDDYGRLLAYVYRVDDGLFVNMELVRRGFARPLTIKPNTAHASEFVDAARAAEAGNVGLWGRCTG